MRLLSCPLCLAQLSAPTDASCRYLSVTTAITRQQFLSPGPTDLQRIRLIRPFLNLFPYRFLIVQTGLARAHPFCICPNPSLYRVEGSLPYISRTTRPRSWDTSYSPLCLHTAHFPYSASAACRSSSFLHALGLASQPPLRKINSHADVLIHHRFLLPTISFLLTTHNHPSQDLCLFKRAQVLLVSSYHPSFFECGKRINPRHLKSRDQEQDPDVLHVVTDT